MDMDDFILTEIEDDKTNEILNNNIKKINKHLIIDDLDERPASIPPNEPFEDLGFIEDQEILVNEARETQNAKEREIVEDTIVPIKVS